jgi:hypothetical protein
MCFKLPVTYTVTASATGYVSESIQVSVIAGVITTQDFALTLATMIPTTRAGAGYP